MKVAHLRVIPVSEEKLCQLCLEWIKTELNVDTLKSLKVGVSLEVCDSVTQSMKFVGRDHTVDGINQLFENRYRERHHPAHKTKHPVGIMGSAPGMGKTRTLVEVPHFLKQRMTKKKVPWFQSVISTYNSGVPPTSREMAKDGDIRSNAFAIRVLFFMLLKQENGERIFQRLDQFLDKILQNDWAHLIRITTVARLIEVIMKEKHGMCCTEDCPGVLYIGIDEYNILLNKSENALTTVVADLNNLVQSCGRRLFIFPVLAGTMLHPLQEILSESQFEYSQIPIKMLDDSHLSELIGHDPKWAQWFTSKVSQVFFDYCKIPRLAEHFLTYVDVNCDQNHTPEEALGEIRSCLESKLSQRAVAIGCLGRKLVGDIMLQTCVRRDQLVERGSPTTYGTLERKGGIVISTDREGNCFVEAPFPLLRIMVANCPLDPCIQSLRTFLNRYSPATTSWESFEKLCQHHAAIREMLFYERGISQLPLRDFFPGAVGSDEVLDRVICLSEIVKIKTAEKRIQADYPCDDDIYTTTSWVNARGAKYDGFFDRERVEGDERRYRHRVCFQDKFWNADRSINRDTIQCEKENVAETLCRSVYESEHTLVIVATQCNVTLARDVPPNCLVLGGTALRRYFGNAISSHVVGMFPHECIYVNADSKKRLQKIKGISDNVAKKIIAKRKEKTFENWDDLKRRVPQVRYVHSASRHYLKYSV